MLESPKSGKINPGQSEICQWKGQAVMQLTIELPDEIAQAMRLPAAEIPARIKQELASRAERGLDRGLREFTGLLRRRAKELEAAGACSDFAKSKSNY
jgi:hypothetical protein